MTTATQPLLEHGIWRLDPARSHIGFAIRHLRIATVRGRFGAFSCRIRETGGALRIEGRVEAGSVDTGEPIRDDRLRNGFFQVERFPAIDFGARCTTPAPGKDWVIPGLLSIRDVTRPVILRAKTEPLDPDTVRVVAEGEIRRSDFGLEWAALREAGKLLVADTVKLQIGAVLARERSADADR
jgi:polyisoprenoid-binding protein YceI